MIWIDFFYQSWKVSQWLGDGFEDFVEVPSFSVFRSYDSQELLVLKHTVKQRRIRVEGPKKQLLVFVQLRNINFRSFTLCKQSNSNSILYTACVKKKWSKIIRNFCRVRYEQKFICCLEDAATSGLVFFPALTQTFLSVWTKSVLFCWQQWRNWLGFSPL